MGLNHDSASHLEQYAELELLLANNEDAVELNVEFAERRVLYGEGMEDCYKLRDTANGSTAGFTKAKNAPKKVSSKSGSALTGKGVSYGIKTGNVELQGQMETWSENYLYRKKDGDFASEIQNIYTALEALIVADPDGTLLFFTMLQLDAMLENKGLYEKKLGLYKNALDVINAAKKNFKELQIPVMDRHITYLEGFLEDISVEYPDFVLQFRAVVKKLKEIGKRRQGVSAVMMYALDDKLIALVGRLRITNYPVVKRPKVINVNSVGVIDFLKLKIGEWDGVFSAPGCVDKLVQIKVVNKKMTIVVVRMERDNG